MAETHGRRKRAMASVADTTAAAPPTSPSFAHVSNGLLRVLQEWQTHPYRRASFSCSTRPTK